MRNRERIFSSVVIYRHTCISRVRQKRIELETTLVNGKIRSSEINLKYK